jgi:hypothetical protein
VVTHDAAEVRLVGEAEVGGEDREPGLAGFEPVERAGHADPPALTEVPLGVVVATTWLIMLAIRSTTRSAPA